MEWRGNTGSLVFKMISENTFQKDLGQTRLPVSKVILFDIFIIWETIPWERRKIYTNYSNNFVKFNNMFWEKHNSLCAMIPLKYKSYLQVLLEFKQLHHWGDRGVK